MVCKYIQVPVGMLMLAFSWNADRSTASQSCWHRCGLLLICVLFQFLQTNFRGNIIKHLWIRPIDFLLITVNCFYALISNFQDLCRFLDACISVVVLGLAAALIQRHFMWLNHSYRQPCKSQWHKHDLHSVFIPRWYIFYDQTLRQTSHKALSDATRC